MIWKTIPNFSNYEISEFGQVRRHSAVHIKKVGRRKKPGELLKSSNHKYPSYSLVNDTGDIIRKRLSHFLLLTFVEPQPTPKHQALHWDDNQQNNHWSNLRWGTSKNNGSDKIRNKKTSIGSANGATKLTEEMVLEARNLYTKGYTLKKLSEKYRITITPIWAAIVGKTWKHLPNSCCGKYGYNQGRKYS